jgi:hypothetical protein
LKIIAQKIPQKAVLLLIIVLAAGWKILFLIQQTIPFNSDEAIVGLMARHILAGERPIFFYGQAYMGSLDAFLVAGMFAILGQQVWVIRLVQILLYLLTIITTVRIGEVVFSSVKVGLLAGLFLAIPTVNGTLYTTASLGGYGEALLIGNLLLLISFEISNAAIHQDKRALLKFFLWGVIAGLGFWAFGFTLVYSIPCGVYIFWSIFLQNKEGSLKNKALQVGLILLGGILGSSPWWVAAFLQGPDALLQELLGSAIAVNQQPFGIQIVQHILNLVVLGLPVIFGLRPPWQVRWLALPLMAFVLAFFIGIGILYARQLRSIKKIEPQKCLLLGVGLTLIVGFLFTPFGGDPSGRYFLPFSVLIALLMADAIFRFFPGIKWQVGMVVILLTFNAWGTIESAGDKRAGITTQFDPVTIVDHSYDQQLIQFLQENGATMGFTNYWIAYPITFLSQETIVLSPRLPYHPDLRYSERDDRYPAYTQQALQSDHPVYITSNNLALDSMIREGFQTMKISWLEEKIGDYQIFYQLSMKVIPEQLGLGSSTQ